MPDIWMDVDTALSEVPVNIMPLLDSGDFVTRETSVAYDAAGMDLVWNFVTTAGAYTQTAVTPTSGGNYDWAHQGDGMYSIEIPASGGASINNDTEGFGWFTGLVTGVLPWRGPVIGFRAAALNNSLIDGTTIDVNVTAMAAGTVTAAAIATGAIDADAIADNAIDAGAIASDAITAAKIATGAITSAKFAAGAIDAAAIATDAIGAAELADGAITAATFAAGAIDAAAIAANAIGASELAADAASEIASAVRTELTTELGRLDVAVSTRQATATIRSNTAQAGAAGTITLDASASATNDLYNGLVVAILSGTGAGQARLVTDYAGATKVASVSPNWTTNPSSDSVFVLVPWGVVDVALLGGDSQSLTDIKDFADAGYDPSTNQVEGVKLADTLTTYTGNTPQTGDAFARLGAPAGASVSADIAAIEAQTDDIGAAGAGLSAVPWNAAWGAEVQSEVADALAAYDPPTHAEMTAEHDTLPTAGEVADAVWEETLADHSGTTGSTAEALGAAGAAGDPWTTALPGAYGAGSAGRIIGDNLNATVSSRASQASVDTVDDFLDTEVAAIKAKTDNLPASPAAVGSQMTLADDAITNAKIAADAIGSSELAATAASEIASAVRTELATELGRVDVAVSSRLATAGYTAPPTAAQNADAVWDEPKADHTTADTFGDYLDDEITSRSTLDAAGVRSAVGLGSANLDTQLTAIDDAVDTEVAAVLAAVDTEVAAIKAKTDLIPAAPAAVGDIPTANANADALLDRANGVETGLTPRQALRLLAAALAGELSGGGTTTITIRNAVADSKDRITATVTAAGDRTAIVYDLS